MSKGNAMRMDYLVESVQGERDPASQVAARLRRSGRAFFWGIRCEFDEGVLSLSGTVPTFHLKQLAQELALHTPGVQEVNNGLQVTSSSIDRQKFDKSIDSQAGQTLAGDQPEASA